MAPINSLSVLAFASAALAVPHQWQPFKRHAHPAAPPAYDPPAYGSSAAPASSVPAYGSSAAPASSSWSVPAYGSYSSAAPVSSSYSVPGYGSWSSAAPASSSAYDPDCDEGSSAAPVASSYGVPGYGSSAGPASSSWSIPAYGSYSSAAPASSAPSGHPSYSVCTETTTKIWRSTTQYSTYYITHTIYATKSASEAVPTQYAPVDPTVSAPPAYEPEGSCVPDVTVTTTEKTTVYVTLGAPSSAAPVPSYAPAYAPPEKDYSKPAPVPSSAAPAPSSYPEPSGSPPSGGYSSKRGLAYNDASLCNAFAGSKAAGWAYNWLSDGSGLDSSIPYIPMLWGPAPEFSDSWAANAKKGIEAGAQYLFSFNEVDMSSQSNLSPQAAAEAWMTYMEPFAGQAKLVAPSVTNGQDANMGLGWLQQFLDACSQCTIDAYAQHWYFPTNDADNFKDQITKAAALGGGKPVFINEFGATGSDEEKSEFLKEVLPWLDSNDSVLGYSYFMVADGLLNSGSSLSAYGETYANA